MNFSFIIRTIKNEVDKQFFERLDFESFKIEFIRDPQIPEDEARRKYDEFNKADPLDPWGPDHQVFFAESREGELTGLVWLAKRTPFYLFEKPLVWIYNLHIIPKFRGLGIARSLLTKTEEWARSEQYDLIGLHVMDFNTPARRLYSSMGYTQVGSHNESCFYQKKIKPSLIM